MSDKTKSPVRCEQGKPCPHCGGTHYGSVFCPYTKTDPPPEKWSDSVRVEEHRLGHIAEQCLDDSAGDIRKARCGIILSKSIIAAMNASAPAGHKCSDCTMDNEPCPRCYKAAWKKKHPNTHQMPE